jgi:glycosyltransferase involved in cell wall biosynthesis
VAALTTGKGHDLLLRALATVRDRWTLTCAGSLTRQPEAVARVREIIRQHQLEDRVQLAGELDEAALEREFAQSDLFALATRRETYGMAIAEAIAHGLPVVSTTTGAIPKIVGDAGLLVAPGDEAAFGAALQRAIGDASLRGRFAANARRQRDTLPTWDAAAASLSELLQAVDHERIAR